MEWVNSIPEKVFIVGLICSTLLLIAVIGFNQVSISLGKNVINIKSKRKRTCSDCLMLFGKKYATYLQEQNKILDHALLLGEQMRNVESKLDKYKLSLFQKYQLMLMHKRQEGSTDTITIHREDKEFEFFQLLMDKCFTSNVKLEIRRSFKENGFSHMNTKDYAHYLQTKKEDILNIIKIYIMNRYPSKDMLVTKDEIDQVLTLESIDDVITDIYKTAKEYNLRQIEQMAGLDKRFKIELDEYVHEVQNG